MSGAVRILVDALYSRQEVLGSVNVILEGLSVEDGIEVRAANAIPTLGTMDVRAMKERDHRKLIVIDGEVAFVSGRNVGDAYYWGFDEVPIADFTEHERVPWLDAHLELKGPLVGGVRRTFLLAFAEANGEPVSEAVAMPAPALSLQAIATAGRTGRGRTRLVPPGSPALPVRRSGPACGAMAPLHPAPRGRVCEADQIV